YIYNPDSNRYASYYLEKYPVLYELDAEIYMPWVTNQLIFLSANNAAFPPMIVVGIETFSYDRTMDMTPTSTTWGLDGKPGTVRQGGGAEKFLQFVREEVMPYVEQHYKTAPFKIYSGHSLAGLNSAYCLLSHPDMFSAYIAMSPSLVWDNLWMMDYAAQKLNSKGLENKYLFISDAVEFPLFNQTVSRFDQLIKEKGPAGLHELHINYPLENHGSQPPKAFFDGIRFIYPDWGIAITDTTLALVKAHYRRLSERYGYTIDPPATYLNDWAYSLMGDFGKTDPAIEIFRYNVEQHPGKWEYYDSLGDGYAAKGDKQQAISSYRKAISLDPKNSGETQNKLKALELGNK
ncbi:MAG TPA: alpha/beta hydrolase-fold protein, partial [Mucilaginibacter sp.]|nr:alpha/beta hydrolase-fold protein [Mucilaginibacter sp.]